jgi:hypothetical protein
MANSLIACPALSSGLADLGAGLPDKYRDCQPLVLRQFWDGPEALPEEVGTAYVGAAAEGLSFYVLFEDSDIFSTARADNQQMWTLGDVAEFFVKPGVERPDYWEIHVTPNSYVMDIYIPDRQRFMGGEIKWEEVLAASSGVHKRVQVSEGRWAVEAVIPWQAFKVEGKPAAGTVWQFAVCRYNYNGGLNNPEHSSTAAFSELGFHRYEEFADLVF